MSKMTKTIVNREVEHIEQPAPSSEGILIDENSYIFKTVYGGSVFAKYNGEEEIDDHEFENNNILKRVTIPVGITRIGSYAFHSCESLECVRLPSSVIMIGSNAFTNCKNLTTVDILAEIGSILIHPDAFPEHTIINYIEES